MSTQNKKSGRFTPILRVLKNPVFLIMFIFLCLYALSVIFALGWGIMTSFKENVDFASRGPLAWPDFSYWDLNKGIPGYENYDNPFGNYTDILMNAVIEDNESWVKGIGSKAEIVSYSFTLDMGDFIWNTLLYAGVASVLRVTGPCIVGYLCSKYKYKFSSIIYTYVIFVMVTPIIGTTTAMLNFVRQLGLYDNWFGLFIRSFGFGGMYFLVFYAFFEGASNSYAEAAEIDGASQFSVLFTIYVPLAMTMIGTVVLLNFVSAWNDYNTALMYMPSHLTLAYAIWYFSQGTSGNDNAPRTISAVMLLAVPIMILFVIFKDKLMGNLSLGGLKE